MSREHLRERYPALVEHLRKARPFAELERALRAPPARALRLPVPAAAWVVDELARGLGRRVLFLAAHDREVRLACESSQLLSGAEGLVEFPAPPLSPYTGAERPLAIEAAEVAALVAVAEGKIRGLVVPVRALFRRLPQPGSLSGLELAPGLELDPFELEEKLLSFGFQPADLVEEPGQFARRGGVFDLAVPSGEGGIRIDFWGDEIESLRSFDLGTQRSIGKLERSRVLPLRLDTVGDETPKHCAKLLEEQFRGTRLRAEARTQMERLESGQTFPGWREFLALRPERNASLFDWCPGALVVVLHPGAAVQELERTLLEFEAEAEAARQMGRLVPPLGSWSHPRGQLEERLRRAELEIESQGAPGLPGVDWEGSAVPASSRARLEDLVRALQEESSAGRRSLLVLPAAVGSVWRQRLKTAGIELGSQGLAWIEGDLAEGFQLPPAGLNVFGEDDLPGRRPPSRRRASRPRPGSGIFFGSLRELKVGDLVVHREHGIGRYCGLKRMTLPRELQPLGPGEEPPPPEAVEFLEIEYAGGSRLLLPLERLDLLERYGGIEGLSPRLDELGGTSWARTRTRVSHRIRNLARELVALYAERELVQAPVMEGPSDLELQFLAAFPHEETSDQLEATQAVFTDLTRSRPMDRLLCGDVGFGKTEVAMRAAFRAVESGYQVAVLAPTTLLADQHLEVFRERFEGFPVRIERFSRAVRGRELKQQLTRLEQGEIDIAVGTHRLMSKDLKFARLGLLVVDEEQRFGVAQKERLKQLKKEVHVLALSATPLPRTLQLSLAGLRDLSILETPPRDRLAVETTVVPYSNEVVREAIRFELERGGQIFYVHNRVATLDARARDLRELVPELRLTVIHGQLAESEVARRMRAFRARELDCLVASSIIENGLDIASANTLIVERADRFGLGELYQLRGRVGRGRELGFCYLLVDSWRSLTEEARQRLEALQEFTQLGSGFRIAGRDLEIRGAGNLLGAEQSGHIAAVGIETYLKLLEEAVAELKGERREQPLPVQLDLPVPRAIPHAYVGDERLRLELYRRMAAGEESREALLEELRDRFGPIPPELPRLLDLMELKRLAERIRVQAISLAGRELRLQLRQDARVDPERLVALLERDRSLSFSPLGVLVGTLSPADDSIAIAQSWLQAIEVLP